MNVKTIVSAIALVSAMTFSGSAFAQTMMNGVAVPEAELEAVQNRCAELSTNTVTPEQAQAAAEEDDVNSETGDSEMTAETGVTEESTIDLTGLTTELCAEAGL